MSDDDITQILKAYPQTQGLARFERATGVLHQGVRTLLSNPRAARDALSAKELQVLGSAVTDHGQNLVAIGENLTAMGKEKAASEATTDPKASSRPLTIGVMMLADTVVDSTPRARTREAGTLRSDSVSKLLEDGGDRNAATGRFLPGNRAWMARRPAGPAPKFADGEALWKACEAYFDWVDEHPLYEMQLFTYRGCTTQVPLARMRAMTKGDMCHYLNIQRSTWNGWKRDRPDLARAIERAESVIWGWQFTGAAAGLLDVGTVIRQLRI